MDEFLEFLNAVLGWFEQEKNQNRLKPFKVAVGKAFGRLKPIIRQKQGALGIRLVGLGSVQVPENLETHITDLGSGKNVQTELAVALYYLAKRDTTFANRFLPEIEQAISGAKQPFPESFPYIRGVGLFKRISDHSIGTSGDFTSDAVSSENLEKPPFSDTELDIYSGRTWQLSSLRKNSVDDIHYNFNLSDFKQCPTIGNPVRIFADVVVRAKYATNKLSYSFNRVRLKASIKDETQCKVAYNINNKIEGIITPGITAELFGGPTSGYLEFRSSPNSAIDGQFSLYEEHFLDVCPYKPEFDFDATLEANVYDMSLVAADGKDLSDENKRAVIRALFASELIDFNDKTGAFALCHQRFRIHPENRVLFDE